jgi:hypothetical protein
MEQKNKRHTTTVDAWRRLWSVGANGENIRNKNNKRKKNDKDKTNYNQLPKTRDTHQLKRKNPNNTTRAYPPTTTNQINLYGKNIDLQDVEEYGDIMEKKPPNVLRLLFFNINRLPIKKNTTKSKKLISFIANKQIDIAMLAEIGLYWKNVHPHDKWFERVHEAFQSTKYSIAYNTNEDKLTDTVQFGGVITMATDDESKRVTNYGIDPSGLGRWSWIKLAGREQHALIVVSAYRPVQAIGPNTVYSQHQRFLHQKGNDGDPREIFYHDLKTEIQKWKDEGNHIIVGIDANEDIRTGTTAETFRLMGMREVILHTHKKNSPPSTCDKNNNRQPIDGIFATFEININAGGYFSFNTGCPSDHRPIWIDVPYNSVFGHSTPSIVNPPPKKTKQQESPTHRKIQQTFKTNLGGRKNVPKTLQA